MDIEEIQVASSSMVSMWNSRQLHPTSQDCEHPAIDKKGDGADRRSAYAIVVASSAADRRIMTVKVKESRHTSHLISDLKATACYCAYSAFSFGILTRYYNFSVAYASPQRTYTLQSLSCTVMKCLQYSNTSSSSGRSCILRVLSTVTR